MRINHNIASLNTYRMLNTNSTAGNKALEKLSSGLRINRAGDDAAGLAISEKMRAQVRGLDRAASNAQDGISMIQTAEGGLNEIHSILQRVRELADQSANGTNTADDRKAIQDEVSQLKKEIDRIGDTTEFNTQKLLNGNLESSLSSIVGTNSTTGAKVLTQVAAKLSTTVSLSTIDADGIDFTAPESFSVDNTTLTIDWDKALTDSEKTLLKTDFSAATASEAQQEDIKAIFNRVVNEAIDAYNASNGAALEHVRFYEDASGNLNVDSGKLGQNSQLATGAVATGVLATYLDSAAASNVGQDRLTVGVPTEDLAFEINGVKLKTGALALATAGDNATTVATDIQAKMRTAIDNYNIDAGLVKGMEGFIDKDALFVNAVDGRFVVTSQSGAVTFNEREGSTLVKDLGLTQAQAEAAGSGGMTFQIGANRAQTITFGISDVRTAALGIASVDVSTASGAQAALTSIDAGIKTVSSERSKLGAVQNRLEHTINNLNTSAENLTAAESRIRDVDMAKEMMEFTKNNILSQAAQAMLAQANQQPQGVLQLLR